MIPRRYKPKKIFVTNVVVVVVGGGGWTHRREGGNSGLDCKKLLKGAKHVLISSEFDPIVKWKSKITKGIEEYLKCYKEEALEKSKVVKQTKVTSFFTIVEQNAEKPGPSGQKIQ